MGGSNRHFDNANCSSSKKRKILRLPSNDNHKFELVNKFDLGELETVVENNDTKNT